MIMCRVLAILMYSLYLQLCRLVRLGSAPKLPVHRTANGRWVHSACGGTDQYHDHSGKDILYYMFTLCSA